MALHFSQQLLGRRVCAYCLDGLVIAVLSIGIAGLLAISGFKGLSLYSMVAAALAVIYGAAMEATPWQATFGKRLCSLRVLSSGSSVPALPQTVVRNILKFIASIAILMSTGPIFFRLMPYVADTSASLWVVLGLQAWSYAILFGLGLIYLALRFGPASQVLHDRLAATQVDRNKTIIPN